MKRAETCPKSHAAVASQAGIAIFKCFLVDFVSPIPRPLVSPISLLCFTFAHPSWAQFDLTFDFPYL